MESGARQGSDMSMGTLYFPLNFSINLKLLKSVVLYVYIYTHTHIHVKNPPSTLYRIRITLLHMLNLVSFTKLGSHNMHASTWRMDALKIETELVRMVVSSTNCGTWVFISKNAKINQGKIFSRIKQRKINF